MEHIAVIITILTHNQDILRFSVANPIEKAIGTYQLDLYTLTFNQSNTLTKIIDANQFQFIKILSSALKGNVLDKTNIAGILIPGFPFLENKAFENYIRITNFSNPMHIETHQKSSNKIPRIITDGSYNSQQKRAAFAGILEIPGNEPEVFSGLLPKCNSNQSELIAVIEGVKRIQHLSKIQINTDSRFVIKGLIQWVHFWKLNNWQTAFGKPVKFTDEWKTLYELCQGKCIELKWIKGHAGNPSHTFCHNLARQLANA